MAKTKEFDLDKLPKWARQRIETLERDLESALKKFAEQIPQDGNGRVILDANSGWDRPDLRMPTRTRVRFEFDKLHPAHHRPPHIEVWEDAERQRLIVHSTERIWVTPNASNSFEVRMDRD